MLKPLDRAPKFCKTNLKNTRNRCFKCSVKFYPTLKWYLSNISSHLKGFPRKWSPVSSLQPFCSCTAFSQSLCIRGSLPRRRFYGSSFFIPPKWRDKKKKRGRLYPRSIDNRGIKWVITAGHSLLHSRFRAFLVRRSVACSRLGHAWLKIDMTGYYSIPTRGRESEESKPITVLETQSDYWVCILRQVSFKYYWILY